MPRVGALPVVHRGAEEVVRHVPVINRGRDAGCSQISVRRGLHDDFRRAAPRTYVDWDDEKVAKVIRSALHDRME